MKFNLEKFNEYYDYEVRYEKDLYIISKSTKADKLVLLGTTNYLTYEQRPKDKDEAEELVKLGLIDKVTTEDLYKVLLKYDDEMLCKRKFGYGLKTKDYIEKTMKEVGFKDFASNWDEIDNKYFVKLIEEVESKDPIQKFRSIIRTLGLYKTENDYVIQYCDVQSPDDYSYIKYYFDKEPTAQDFELAEFCIELDSYLIYECNICEGAEYINGVHWSDLDGTFREKVSKLLSNINNLRKTYED